MISELINHRSLQRVLNLLLSPSRRCPAQWLCGGHNYCQRTNCGGLHNYKILHSFPLKTKSMLDLINLPLCHSHKVVVFKAGEFYYFCQFLLVEFFWDRDKDNLSTIFNTKTSFLGSVICNANYAYMFVWWYVFQTNNNTTIVLPEAHYKQYLNGATESKLWFY